MTNQSDISEAVQTSQLWQQQYQESRDNSNIQTQLDTLNARSRFLEETLLALTGLDMTQPNALATAFTMAHTTIDADLHPAPTTGNRSSGVDPNAILRAAIVMGVIGVFFALAYVLHAFGVM